MFAFYTPDGWRRFAPPTFLLKTLCITFLQTTFFVQNVLYFCNVIKAKAMQKRTIFEKLSKVEYIPPTKKEGVNLLFKKGKPVHKCSSLFGERICKRKKYKEDVYGDECRYRLELALNVELRTKRDVAMEFRVADYEFVQLVNSNPGEFQSKTFESTTTPPETNYEYMFDKNGLIVSMPCVVVWFLDGTSKKKYFYNEESALNFFAKFKKFLTNEL